MQHVIHELPCPGAEDKFHFAAAQQGHAGHGLHTCMLLTVSAFAQGYHFAFQGLDVCHSFWQTVQSCLQLFAPGAQLGSL